MGQNKAGNPWSWEKGFKQKKKQKLQQHEVITKVSHEQANMIQPGTDLPQAFVNINDYFTVV